RFPDQWLMFCGVMTRVLAANGLIHAKHADVYRRLMEETPGVERPGAESRGSNPGQSPKAGTVPIDERPPKSWSRIKSMRETETLEALLRKTPKPP
ncbi:MAG: hypothetical protein IT462_09485, partial [Planctomycetes bacterium]|nr:hypothetical protein [Planctomycetota bacterium]